MSYQDQRVGFNLKSGIPLDKRFIVNEYSDLALIEFPYPGLSVWVASEQIKYRLNNDLVTWLPDGESFGGWKSVATISDRNALPIESLISSDGLGSGTRKVGMVASVIESPTPQSELQDNPNFTLDTGGWFSDEALTIPRMGLLGGIFPGVSDFTWFSNVVPENGEKYQVIVTSDGYGVIELSDNHAIYQGFEPGTNTYIWEITDISAAINVRAFSGAGITYLSIKKLENKTVNYQLIIPNYNQLSNIDKLSALADNDNWIELVPILEISDIVGLEEVLDSKLDKTLSENKIWVGESDGFAYEYGFSSDFDIDEIGNEISINWSGGYDLYDDRYVSLTGSYSDPDWIIDLAYSKLIGAPTDLSDFIDDIGFAHLSSAIFTGSLKLHADATDPLEAVTLQQMNAALIGLWNDRGNFTPSGTFPTSGGSGVMGAIRKGDIWTIYGLGSGISGTVGGYTVQDGDTLRALINYPGSTNSNWATGENNLGYTPLSNTLSSAYLFVGNSSNAAIGVQLSLNASPGTFGLSNTGALTIPNADTSTRGLITSTDWNIFNNKQQALNGIGFVKISGTTIAYDNSVYLTANQTITWTASGDVSGTDNGTTSLSPSINVIGLRGVSLPSLSAGFLKYDGSAWIFDNSIYLTQTSGDVRYLQLSGGTLTGNLNGVTPTEITYLSGATSNLQGQINNINSGLSWKVGARILVDSNVNISSPGSSLDSITMVNGDRVILNGQSAGAQNGLYVWNGTSSPMTRSADATTGGAGSTGVEGMTIQIEEGTYADQMWVLTTNRPIIIGTTALTYAKSSATTYIGNNGIALIGNIFTLDNSYFTGDFTLSGGISTITKLNGKTVTLGGTFITSGVSSITLTSTGITNITLPTSGTLIANPMSVAGDTMYGGTSGFPTRLAGDTSNTRKFLRSQSISGVSTAPSWDTFTSNDINSAYSFTNGSVLFWNSGISQNNSSFYFSSGILSVATGGDTTGTDSINVYNQIDAFQNTQTGANGYTVSNARGSVGSFTQNIDGDYIGLYGFYPYNGSSWNEYSSIRGYVQGTTSSNRGGKLSFYTKADAGSIIEAGNIDNNQILNLIKSDIRTTNTTTLTLANLQASTASILVQYSPRILWSSRVWNTTSVAADNYIDFTQEVIPISGNSPTGNMIISGRISTLGTGSYNQVLSLGTVSNAINSLVISNSIDTINVPLSINNASGTNKRGYGYTITTQLGTGNASPDLSNFVIRFPAQRATSDSIVQASFLGVTFANVATATNTVWSTLLLSTDTNSGAISQSNYTINANGNNTYLRGVTNISFVITGTIQAQLTANNLSTSANVALGANGILSTGMLTTKGADSLATAWAFRADSSTVTNIFSVRNDGRSVFNNATNYFGIINIGNASTTVSHLNLVPITSAYTGTNEGDFIYQNVSTVARLRFYKGTVVGITDIVTINGNADLTNANGSRALDANANGDLVAARYIVPYGTGTMFTSFSSSNSTITDLLQGAINGSWILNSNNHLTNPQLSTGQTYKGEGTFTFTTAASLMTSFTIQLMLGGTGGTQIATTGTLVSATSLTVSTTYRGTVNYIVTVVSSTSIIVTGYILLLNITTGSTTPIFFNFESSGGTPVTGLTLTSNQQVSFTLTQITGVGSNSTMTLLTKYIFPVI